MLDTSRTAQHIAREARQFNVTGGERHLQRGSFAMPNPTLDERAAPARMADALDFSRLDEIERLANLARSYWQSTALAAERGDTLTIVVHCKQIAAVTREAFAIVKTLAETEAAA
jgi:hypothetical protein